MKKAQLTKTKESQVIRVANIKPEKKEVFVTKPPTKFASTTQTKTKLNIGNIESNITPNTLISYDSQITHHASPTQTFRQISLQAEPITEGNIF